MALGDAGIFDMGNTLLKSFVKHVEKELRLLADVDNELKSLQTTLVRIHSLLDEADRRKIRDRSLSLWLVALRDVAHDAADIVDEYDAREFRQYLVRKLLARFRTSFGICRIKFQVAHKIVVIRERLEDITKTRELHVRELEGTEKLDVTQVGETSSLLIEPQIIIGREEDKKMVIGLVLGPRDQAESSRRVVVPVLPIVGLAGVGKTALAQLVFNDDRVVDHFDLRMWVCVSDDFDVKRITKELIECVRKETLIKDIMNLNTLQEILKECISKDKFLLVLDNVWNEDHENWESLCRPLVGGHPGSTVMVTTRNTRVADITGTMKPYVLDCLSPNDLWSVLGSCSFRDENFVQNPKLEVIGRDLAEKLNGLPYGAKKLGQFLRSNKQDEKNWRQILKTNIWEMAPDAGGILSALVSSYEHLPDHLKLCFACCSLFPRGYKFNKDKLVHIWMAYGLIQPLGTRRTEDIGTEYFDDLLCRFFFQISEEGYYVMHDSIYDLAKFVSLNEYVGLDSNSSLEIPKTIRHLSWCGRSVVVGERHLCGRQDLRTLLFYGVSFESISTVFAKLKLLRVLVLSNCDIQKLPDSIGDLQHLRYLGLSDTSITSLPKSIVLLYHLQTLNLEKCKLSRLPENMSRLRNLRHLIADEEIVADIARIGRLTALQELKVYNVYKRRGHSIRELQRMNQIQGSLSIKNLQFVRRKSELADAELHMKEHLDSLQLEWAADVRNYSHHSSVLDGLKPHRQLKELNIRRYMGEQSPSWMLDQYLSNIETIRLHDCKRWTELSPLGSHQFLKHLEIEGMDAVKEISLPTYGEGEINGFPSLEILSISNMSSLKAWQESEEISLFPCLTKLHIINCLSLAELPTLPSTLREVRISGAGLTALPKMRKNDVVSESIGRLSLYISNCQSLTSLHEGLLRDNQESLFLVSITECTNLSSLPEEGFRSAVGLKSLTISDCPMLKSLPDDGSLPSSLEILVINRSLGLSLRSDNHSLKNHLRKLTSLSCLELTYCPKLTSLPLYLLSGLRALTTLLISGCEELTSVAFEALDSLENLTIINCPKLTSSPDYPENCNSMFTQLLQNLISLQYLSIRECPQLEKFSEEEQKYWENLTSLRQLDFFDCPNLKSLPAAIGSLSSLSTVRIVKCPKISSLPTNGLSESLHKLVINGCSELIEQCRGVSQHLITGISDITLDEKPFVPGSRKI